MVSFNEEVPAAADPVHQEHQHANEPEKPKSYFHILLEFQICYNSAQSQKSH